MAVDAGINAARIEEPQGSHEIFKYMVGEEGYNRILEVYKKWKDEGRLIREHEEF
jgi:hypothetical protein